MLGGSGSINALVYYRGLPGDFDDWRALGNPGWGFSDVLPYFQRFEDRAAAPTAAARGGPLLHISDVSADVHPLCQNFIDSCRALGFATQDFNGAQGEGVGIYQIMTRNGRRESTARGYLHPALHRENLTLLMRARALRILFEKRRAVGVSYRQAERTLAATARRGVILCGGAINSPHLLQLSGVGEGALLARHGIEVVAESPAVGRNLQDHLAVSYFYRSKVPTLNDVFRPLAGKARVALRYLATRRGPLSFNACRPTSRGHVEIRSANPLEAPAIQPNSLATAEDVADVVAGVHLLRSIAATAPLAHYIESEMLPGSAKQTDAQLLQDFRERAGTVFHPVSTCRMGPDPASAVVDATLRVYGVEGLRVIDASVFPTVTSGNTNAPTIMVAEKGAALIAAEEDG